MFDIGFWEIFLILVMALIVIGPDRLPGAARKAGYWIGRARRFVEGVKSDVESELDVGEFKRLMHNQEVQIRELQSKLAQAGDLSGDDQPEHRYDPVSDDVDDIIEDEETYNRIMAEKRAASDEGKDG